MSIKLVRGLTGSTKGAQLHNANFGEMKNTWKLINK